MKRLYTPPLSDLSLSYLSISNPSLFKPSLRLVSLVSLITKTKRIAERSAITDTQTKYPRQIYMMTSTWGHCTLENHVKSLLPLI